MRLKLTKGMTILGINLLVLCSGCTTTSTSQSVKATDLELINISKPLAASSTMNTGHVYYKIIAGGDLKSKQSLIPTIGILGPTEAHRVERNVIDTARLLGHTSQYLLNVVYDPAKCRKNNSASKISFISDDVDLAEFLPIISIPKNCAVLSYGLIPINAKSAT